MGLAWHEGAGRGVSWACHLGAPGTVEEVSSGGQFLGWTQVVGWQEVGRGQRPPASAEGLSAELCGSD